MLCYLLCYMMIMVSCSKLSFVFLFVHKLLYSNSVLGSVLIAQGQIPCVMTFVCKFVSLQDGYVFCSAGNIFCCQGVEQSGMLEVLKRWLATQSIQRFPDFYFYFF